MPINAILPALAKLSHLTNLWLSGFQLESLRNAAALGLPKLVTIEHLSIKPSRPLSSNTSSESGQIISKLCHTFPSIRILHLKQCHPIQFDPIRHLAQFAHLTHFKLWVYKQDTNPLMLSGRHRTGYEQTWARLKWVDQIEQDVQYGRQVWRRKSSIVMQQQEDSQKLHFWTKEKALVWDFIQDRSKHKK